MIEQDLVQHLEVAQEFIDSMSDAHLLSRNEKDQMTYCLAAGILHDSTYDTKYNVEKENVLIKSLLLCDGAIERGYVPGITPPSLRRQMDIFKTLNGNGSPLDVLERIIMEMDFAYNPESSDEAILKKINMKHWTPRYEEAKKIGRKEYLAIMKEHNRAIKHTGIRLTGRKQKDGLVEHGIMIPSPYNFGYNDVAYWHSTTAILREHVRKHFYALGRARIENNCMGKKLADGTYEYDRNPWVGYN